MVGKESQGIDIDNTVDGSIPKQQPPVGCSQNPVNSWDIDCPYLTGLDLTHLKRYESNCWKSSPNERSRGENHTYLKAPPRLGFGHGYRGETIIAS